MRRLSEQVREVDGPIVGPPVDTLTVREREVAALVAQGLTNIEIAARLVITPGTAANHIARIMRVLGARSRVHVAVWAVEHGLYRSGDRPCPSATDSPRGGIGRSDGPPPPRA